MGKDESEMIEIEAESLEEARKMVMAKVRVRKSYRITSKQIISDGEPQAAIIKIFTSKHRNQ